MHIISIDTATKSLAVSIIKYNTGLADDIIREYNTYISVKAKTHDIILHMKNYVDLLTRVDMLLDNRIKILYLDVIDLIPGKKVVDTTVQDRAKSLFNFLNNTIDPLINASKKDDEWVFLLESQMSPNKSSNVISSQIIYHFSKYSYPIELIGASLKNKIVIGGKEAEYSNFLESYKTNYAANKAHSKYCFLNLIKSLKKESLIKHISKKNIDDIADSVLQSLAYAIKYKSF